MFKRSQKYMAKYYYSPIKQKIILLMWTGLALGLAAPVYGKQARILRNIPRELAKVGRRTLRRIVHEFHRDRLVDFGEQKDGSIRIVLSELGVKRALQYDFEKMEIVRPAKWDKLWRLVIFDIPEKKKRAREALRRKLRELGFYQLQKSVFVFPYECRNEIDFITEFFELRQNVRLVTATHITNEAELKPHFNLS